MEKYDVFVSYRRDGGEALACLISERLKQRGFSVFYDFESLRSGKFNEKIFSVIDNCTDVIVVLPPNGLDRCINTDDWVRKEISYAIKMQKNIIPIMMRNFNFPSELPDEIDEIRNFNGISANMEYFEATFDKLLSMLNSSNVISQDIIKQLTTDETLQNQFKICIENVKNKNTAESKYNLAECYRQLNNNTYNEEMAKLYLQAAQQGHPEAQNAIGACYQFGIGVEENIERAIEWYKVSADQNCVIAQYNLGICYYENYDKLYIIYLEKAAEQNYDEALYQLGSYYESNEDYTLAKEYYEKAAEFGHKKAIKITKGKIKKLALLWAVIKKFISSDIANIISTILSVAGLIALLVLLAER